MQMKKLDFFADKILIGTCVKVLDERLTQMQQPVFLVFSHSEIAENATRFLVYTYCVHFKYCVCYHNMTFGVIVKNNDENTCDCCFV